MTDPPAFHFADYVPRRLEIIDTTLREGSQTSLLHDHFKYHFSREDKIEIVSALIVFGVKFIELFAPVVSAREREDFVAIRETRDRLLGQRGYAFLLAHVRCHPADVQAAIDAGFDGLNFYIGTSDVSQHSNHGKRLDQIIPVARRLIEDVRSSHPHLVLRFSGEDAFRTREESLFRVYDEIAPLVDRLGTPDTVGVATPTGVARRVETLRARYPDTDLEGHFHDDRGLALVNALEGAKAGMRYIDTTLLGVGERSGITSMTALLFNLFVDREFDRLKGYDLRDSYPINVILASKLKKLVQSKEPVSLTNRTHAAGVHGKAVLHDPTTYEAHPLDQFGVDESDILLGPLSGWNVIHYFLKEIKYFHIDEETAKRITAEFKHRVYGLGTGDHPGELLVQIAENEFGCRRVDIPDAYREAVVQNMEPREPDDQNDREAE